MCAFNAFIEIIAKAMRIYISRNNILTGGVRFTIRGRFLWYLWDCHCRLRCLWDCYCRLSCLSWLLWSNYLRCCLRRTDIFYDLSINHILASNRNSWLGSWNRNRWIIHCVCGYWLSRLCRLLIIYRLVHYSWLLIGLVLLLVWSSASLLDYLLLGLSITLNSWLRISSTWGSSLASWLSIY